MGKPDLRVHLDELVDPGLGSGPEPAAVCNARRPRRFTVDLDAVDCPACRRSGTWRRVYMRQKRAASASDAATAQAVEYRGAKMRHMGLAIAKARGDMTSAQAAELVSLRAWLDAVEGGRGDA